MRTASSKCAEYTSHMRILHFRSGVIGSKCRRKYAKTCDCLYEPLGPTPTLSHSSEP